MAVAGRILIMPRGAYNENTTYEMLDLVLYNGTAWLAKKTSVGIEPSDGEYWMSLLGIEIVDDLNTEEEGKALSAKQGKVLKELIDEMNELVEDEFISEWLMGTVKFTKKNGMVFVTYNGEWVEGTPSGEFAMFEIPPEFMPLAQVDTMCFPTIGDNHIQVSILSDGNVIGHNFKEALTTVVPSKFNVCYVAAN